MNLRQRTTTIIGLAFTVFLWVGGLKGDAWALTSEGSLQLDGDRLTGNLSQVTLRTVLEQLHKQLGVTYEAPEGELDKVISVDLQQVPILPALAKILAPWDYAFTVNAAGHLQFLYVTSKAPPAELMPETKPSDVHPSDTMAETESGSFPSGDSGQEAGDVDFALPQDHKSDPFSPSASTPGSPPEEMDGFSSPVAGVPMAIQPVPEGTSMPMMPSSGGGGMNVTPAANPPDMPIIPGTSYPPMDIQPVPDYLQEEMLRNIQP